MRCSTEKLTWTFWMATGSTLLPTRTTGDLYSGQCALPQGGAGLGMVCGQRQMAGGPPAARLFAGIECCGTDLASHPSSCDAQSQLQKRPRDPGLIAKNFSQYSTATRADPGISAPISITICPFNYVPSCRSQFL